MKTKRILSLTLLLALIISINLIPNSVVAATMSPQYTYISDTENGLDISGTTLYIDAATYGYFDADKCGVTATLQKKSGSSWSTYRAWSATSPSSHPDFVMLNTSISASSGTYRLVTSHSVTVGNATEYEGMMSDEVTVR